MSWRLAVFVVIGVVATALHYRLAVFRRDQRWRRDRGAAFGDPLMSLRPGEDLQPSLYTPGGRRLLPWVIAFDLVAAGAFFYWIAGQP